MIFTQSSEVPDGVNEVLEEIASISAGMEISELIAGIAQRLLKSLATGSSSDPFDIDDDSDEEMADNEEEPERHDLPDQDENDYDDADFLSDDYDFDDFKSFDADGPPIRRMSAEAATKLNKRIRADLRAAKSAGFKLGILCGLKAESQTGLLSISIQVSKLGLSNEVLQAWDLTPQQHIVLLVRYASGYKTFEGVITEPAKSLDVSFRIGVCHRYKPSPLEAMAAFADVAKGSNSPQHGDSDDVTRFSGLFISSSLNEFLNDAFVSLVKIRTHAGIGWDGAKLFYKNHQGRPYDATFEFTAEYYKERPPAQSSLPEMTKADHLSDAAGSDVSFPLVAAQFAMRYLLRCTEFCLVCHDRLPGDFEALKPYVCSNPLCLYQYMSLGFGPSLEHEILTQPFVVDLLVSLCYTAANVSSRSGR
jgi:ubiquitin-conjugating enzyme E2 Q